MKELVTVDAHGRMRLHFHPGQWRAWQSPRRHVVVLAGTQSGKTTFGPHWLHREIKTKGIGDYMTVSPTFTLMEKKLLPEFKRLFVHQLALGEYKTSPIPCFTFNDSGMKRTFGDTAEVARQPHTQVMFGHAMNPDSLESATIKGCWWDEAGQDACKLQSYEALRRRASLYMARFLYTTTIYNLGWLKTELYDRWQDGDPEVDVIQFDSTENPSFPLDEYEEREANMPRWKFDMMYRGLYTRPAGLIYDSFDTRRHIVAPFAIPDDWPIYAGVDFGGVNTCILLLAEDEKNRRLYVVREYHAGGKTEREHIADALVCPHIGQRRPRTAWGGSHQEGGWRSAFSQSGLPIHEPSPNDVETQMQRVYSTLRMNELFLFRDCVNTREEMTTFSRKLDDNAEPTEEIDRESTFHHMAALRYVVSQRRRLRPTEAEQEARLNQLPVFTTN